MNSDYRYVVHTIGKVASSTIYEAIKSIAGNHCYHTHFLQKDKIQQVSKKLQNVGKTVDGHIADSLEVLNLLSDNTQMRKLRVVSLVRDPLARNVSAFFENLELYGLDPKNLPDAPSLIATFLERSHLNTMDEWFETQFSQVFDLKKRDIAFSKKAGCGLFQRHGVDFMILKAELENWRKERMLQAWLNTEDISLKDANVTANKSVSNHYTAFKKELSRHFDKVCSLYDSPWFNHFYSQEESRQFKAYWQQAATT